MLWSDVLRKHSPFLCIAKKKGSETSVEKGIEQEKERERDSKWNWLRGHVKINIFIFFVQSNG